MVLVQFKIDPKKTCDDVKEKAKDQKDYLELLRGFDTEDLFKQECEKALKRAHGSLTRALEDGPLSE